MSKGDSSFLERGIVHILPLIFVAVTIVIFVGFLLIKGGVIKTTPFSKQSRVTLASEYSNPFNKDSQYVNPFSDYKNPFDNLKQ